jgi:hypothetical protein
LGAALAAKQVEPLIGEAVKRRKGRWGVRRRGREGDPKRLQEFVQFVLLTHKRKNIAEILTEIAKSHRWDDWLKMLEHFDAFQEAIRQYEARGLNRAIIMQAAETLYRYQNDTKLKRRNKSTWDRCVSTLGVAQVIASLELGWRDRNNGPRKISTLSKRYRRGGGRNWTLIQTP